jgi:cytochrome c553
MKRYIISALAMAFLACGLLFVDGDHSRAQVMSGAQAGQEKQMPEVIILGKNTKQGQVTFNHVNHNSGAYNIAGPIACTECHHTAQPKSELAKYPDLKTEWPAGRTTTLTAALYAKDPKGAGVAACRDCHARNGEKPKLIPEIPVIKDDKGTTLSVMTNQLAFHNACDACHFKISVNREDTKVPTATSCRACHKRE